FSIVMALKYRGDAVLGGLYSGVNTKHIIPTSKMVEEYSGLKLQPHKAIVGANKFSHESGIHQDGVLKNRDTCEFVSPEDVVFHRATEHGISLGRLSGRHALKSKMLEKITEEDLRALVSDKGFQSQVA
uniref:2-isopropylmalate synthase A-like n=1 Tax=Nicotiana tabacum TaxID=4097 RepID=A0A1S4ARU9_TOBAC